MTVIHAFKQTHLFARYCAATSLNRAANIALASYCLSLSTSLTTNASPLAGGRFTYDDKASHSLRKPPEAYTGPEAYLGCQLALQSRSPSFPEGLSPVEAQGYSLRPNESHAVILRLIRTCFAVADQPLLSSYNSASSAFP